MSIKQPSSTSLHHDGVEVTSDRGSQQPTGTPDPSLGSRMRRGVAWTALTRSGVQVVQFASSVVLARLLTPESFGLVAIVTTVTGFALLFNELGLSAALVQRSELDERVLSTAFWLNLMVGFGLVAMVVGLSWPLAAFFGEPELRTLLPLASLAFVLSLSVVQTGLMQRALDFRRLGFVGLSSTSLGAVVAISAAASGAGPVSIVLGSLVTTAAVTVQSWMFVRWRPSTGPDRASARELWTFSRGLLGFSAINYWSRNADNLLVGRFLGTVALGFYGRAYSLMMLPVSQLSAVLTSVLFPALSRVQHDRARFAHGWLVSVKSAWLLGAPVGVGVAVTAPALVETVYGSQWLPMVGALALLSASVPAQLLSSNTGAVFQALGRTGLQFRLGLVSTALTLTAIVVGLPFGITGVAAALLVKSWVGVWVPLIPAARLAGVTLGRLLGPLRAGAAATGLMALAVWAVGALGESWAAPALLTAQVAVGVVVYGLLVLPLELGFLRELRGSRRGRTS